MINSDVDEMQLGVAGFQWAVSATKRCAAAAPLLDKVGLPCLWLAAQESLVDEWVRVWPDLEQGLALMLEPWVGVAEVLVLVERYDTVSFSDFSAKLSNFRGFVLFCIEADFCVQIRIFQHFSISTRFAFFCTDQISKFADLFFAICFA